MKNFGGVRRSAAALTSLVVATSGLLALGAAGPSVAVTAGTVYPCTETINSGHPELPERRPDLNYVENAVLTLQVFFQPGSDSHKIFATLRPITDFPSDDHRVAELPSNAIPGSYVFSTLATTSPFTRPDRPGTYGAGQLLDALRVSDSSSPVFAVYTREQSGFPRTLGDWSLDITYNDCDSDGEGLPDSRDNCPTVVNDQRDLDADGVGDVCDADADGDNVVDTSDNCRMLANDQKDADGDGIGNACDSTPFPPAPAPQAPPTGTTTGGTTTGPAPASPVPSARTVTLKYAKKKRVFKGVVGSDVETCVTYAEVSLWRKKRGADRRLVVSTTDVLGKFRTPRVRKPGKYYATVTSIEAVCAAVRSRSVRVRRR